jgi:hypothetical protein
MNAADWWERVRKHPSPLLARQLSAVGLQAADFRPADATRLASLSPRDLELTRLDDPVAAMRLGDAPNPVRLGSCERAGATMVVPFTADDLERIATYGARALGEAGVAAGMRVANTLEGGLETPGSLILGDALERLGALDVPLGPAYDEHAAKALAALTRRIDAQVVIVDGRTGGALVAELRKDPPRSCQGTIWLGVEPPPSVPGWCRRWISVPEVSIFFAVECRSGSLHVDPDVHVDESARRLRLHSLAGDAPLFGYEPDVPLRRAETPCACGDRRLTVILARADPI